MLEPGDEAPAFSLPGSDGGEVREHSLEEHLAGATVVLTFYVFDFHPACTRHVCSLRDLNWFEVAPSVRPLAVSTDSAHSHRAFAAEHDLAFPLLSDSDGRVSEAYGVLEDEYAGHSRVPRRSAFVVDADRTVRYAWVADDQAEQPDWRAVKAAFDV